MNIYCTNCENQCSDTETWCQKCGRPLVAKPVKATATAVKTNIKAPRLTPRQMLRGGVATLFGFMVLSAVCTNLPQGEKPRSTVKRGGAAPPAKTTAKRDPNCDDNPQKQAEREAIIQKMIDQGYWTHMEWSGSLPKLWVTTAFLILPEKMHNTFLNAVYAYWQCKRDDFGGSGFFWDPLVIKIDSGTQFGNRIGDYTPLTGVDWY